MQKDTGKLRLVMLDRQYLAKNDIKPTSIEEVFILSIGIESTTNQYDFLVCCYTESPFSKQQASQLLANLSSIMPGLDKELRKTSMKDIKFAYCDATSKKIQHLNVWSKNESGYTK